MGCAQPGEEVKEARISFAAALPTSPANFTVAKLLQLSSPDLVFCRTKRRSRKKPTELIGKAEPYRTAMAASRKTASIFCFD